MRPRRVGTRREPGARRPQRRHHRQEQGCVHEAPRAVERPRRARVRVRSRPPREAGVREAGALAAVTSGDNSNVLSARIARETFGVPNVVARIYDPRRAVIYQRLGIPTVATVTWTTDQVQRRLFPDTSVTDWADPSGELVLVERSLPDAWAGRRLADLVADSSYRITAVTRAGRARLVESDMVGQEGDLLLIMATKGAVDDLDLALTEQDSRH